MSGGLFLVDKQPNRLGEELKEIRRLYKEANKKVLNWQKQIMDH